MPRSAHATHATPAARDAGRRGAATGRTDPRNSGLTAAAASSAGVAQLQRLAGLAEAAAPVRTVVQREPDIAIRQETDVAVDALKTRTSLILQQLVVRGQDWTTKWGDKAEGVAREKTEQVVVGEEPEPLEKQIARRLWNELTLAQKAEVITEAGGAAAEALASEMSGASAPSTSRGGGGRSRFGFGRSGGSSRRGNGGEGTSSGVSSAVADILGQVTMDDIELAYEVMKAKRKYNEMVGEAKAAIVDAAGTAGRKVGALAGEFRDEGAFEKLIAEMSPDFSGAGAEFDELKTRIKKNGDDARYHDEMVTLGNALRALDVDCPAMGFLLNGKLKAELRIKFPDVCAEALQEIKGAKRDVIYKRFLGVPIPSLAAGEARADSTVAVLREKTAAALKQLVRAKWPATRLTGPKSSLVRALRRLDTGLPAEAYLASARAASDHRDKKEAASIRTLRTALQTLDPGVVASIQSTSELFVGVRQMLSDE